MRGDCRGGAKAAWGVRVLLCGLAAADGAGAVLLSHDFEDGTLGPVADGTGGVNPLRVAEGEARSGARSLEAPLAGWASGLVALPAAARRVSAWVFDAQEQLGSEEFNIVGAAALVDEQGGVLISASLLDPNAWPFLAGFKVHDALFARQVTPPRWPGWHHVEYLLGESGQVSIRLDGIRYATFDELEVFPRRPAFLALVQGDFTGSLARPDAGSIRFDDVEAADTTALERDAVLHSFERSGEGWDQRSEGVSGTEWANDVTFSGDPGGALRVDLDLSAEGGERSGGIGIWHAAFGQPRKADYSEYAAFSLRVLLPAGAPDSLTARWFSLDESWVRRWGAERIALVPGAWSEARLALAESVGADGNPQPVPDPTSMTGLGVELGMTGGAGAYRGPVFLDRVVGHVTAGGDLDEFEFVAIDQDSGGIRLAWSAAGAAATYRVERSAAGPGAFAAGTAETIATLVGATTYLDATIPAGAATLFYRVVAE